MARLSRNHRARQPRVDEVTSNAGGVDVLRVAAVLHSGDHWSSVDDAMTALGTPHMPDEMERIQLKPAATFELSMGYDII